MKKKLIALLATFAILFAPLGAVQARIQDSANKQEMKVLMDQMMVGELDADSQMMLSKMFESKSKDGSRLSKYGNLDKSSPMFAILKIVHILFALLVLSLLFLSNVVLYKKLELMNKKKK